MRHGRLSAGATSETSEPHRDILLTRHPTRTLFHIRLLSFQFRSTPPTSQSNPFAASHLSQPGLPQENPHSLHRSPQGGSRGPPHPSLRLARPKRHATLSSKGSHTGPYAIETGAIPWRDCPLMVGCRVNRTAIQRHGCLSCQCSQGQCSCTQQQDQEVCAEPHWTAGYCHPSL